MNKPLGLDTAIQAALDRGGRCLSVTYKDSRTTMNWACGEGHEWPAPLCRIRSGHWCPVCAGNQPLSLDAAIEAANGRGGKCLSSTYQSCRAPLRWECARGHQWDARLSTIRSGHWCATCGHEVSKQGVRDYFARVRRSKRARKVA